MDHLYSKSCVGSWPIDYMKSMIHIMDYMDLYVCIMCIQIMDDPLVLCEEGQRGPSTCHQGAASVSGKPSFKMDTAYSCTNLRVHQETHFFCGIGDHKIS